MLSECCFLTHLNVCIGFVKTKRTSHYFSLQDLLGFLFLKEKERQCLGEKDLVYVVGKYTTKISQQKVSEQLKPV